MRGYAAILLTFSLFGLASASLGQGQGETYPATCRANAMAMPGHFKGAAAKGPEMSSEMTDYQQSFSLGMRDMNTNMMAG